MKVVYVCLESLQDLLCKPIDHIFKYKDIWFSADVAANFMVVYYTKYKIAKSLKNVKFIGLEANFTITTSDIYKSGYVPIVNVKSITESEKVEFE